MGKTIVLFNPALTLKKKNYSKFFNIQESQKQLEDMIVRELRELLESWEVEKSENG